MDPDVRDLMSPFKEELVEPLDDPSLVEDVGSLEKDTNIMTQGELDHLNESCLFPTGIQTRLPKSSETIMLVRLGEVAFLAGLRFPLHPILVRILGFYIICPA